MMLKQARTLLKNVFGYDDFRPLQPEVIANVLQRRDTLVIMPTGSGKSLCYQIPALLFDGVTLVVSPLISLMQDQVDQLTALGIPAAVLNSSLTPDAYRENVARLARHEIKLLYLAPETLLMPRTLTLLAAQQIDCFVIDEAHCISEWGHDFRPEYRQLIEGRKHFPRAVCIALTATATPRVQQDIQECLHLAAENKFIASFNRPNLFLEIAPKTNPVKQTTDFLQQFPNQSGIIYCLTRREVDELADHLAKKNFSVKPYHAGLDDSTRRRHQEQFIRDDVQIMVATVAFGMGINKPNVRFVLHYTLPQNIESYYQQIGRAGRDGLRAHCLLLFSTGDLQKIRYFIHQKEGQERQVAAMHLTALIGFAESWECRRRPLLQYFDEDYTEPVCGMCDKCLAGPETLVDVTIPAQKFLSCVKRTGERFGATYIIDVLRGSADKRILALKHDQLSTYNIGTEYSQKQWAHLHRQFLQQGLLAHDLEFGGLKLTPKAWNVMRGQERVMGKIDESHETRAPAAPAETASDQALFDILRQKRKAVADQNNVAPYMIFPDKTLLEMATYFPQSPESFLQLYGVGAHRFEQYGDLFLAVLREYYAAHQLAELPKPPSVTLTPPPRLTSDTPRYIIVGAAYNAGASVAALMAEWGVKIGTILDHLYKYQAVGYALRSDPDILSLSTLAPEQRETVFASFAELGADRLRPVFDALHEQVSYEELHLLRLYYVVTLNAA